jgi:hypothetical protein
VLLIWPPGIQQVIKHELHALFMRHEISIHERMGEIVIVNGPGAMALGEYSQF